MKTANCITCSKPFDYRAGNFIRAGDLRAAILRKLHRGAFAHSGPDGTAAAGGRFKAESGSASVHPSTETPT